MLPRIKSIEPKENYKLLIRFDNDELVLYDVLDDINTLNEFAPLKTETGLFRNYQIDKSRTCVFWNDRIDLPSDTLYEYGQKLT